MDWSRFQTQLEALPEPDRRRAVQAAERLIRDNDDVTQEEAMMRALHNVGPAGGRPKPRNAEIQSPDVSLAYPHGPEGESHGGRSARDPLQYVEDSTPAASNAFSRTHGAPGDTPHGQNGRSVKRPASPGKGGK